MLKISKTSKLDGILSWSLQAVETCPGSVGPDGNLVPACSGCYATTGTYLWGPVKAPRAQNKLDWLREGWVADMIARLRKETHFRWFDSGDLYSVDLAQKVLEVCEGTPHISHWLPTRTHKFPKYQAVLAALEALPNVVVRRSSDSVTGGIIPGANTSTIVEDASKAPKGATICRAYEHGGECSGCRACWSKDVPLIAYVAHGHKIRKVIALMKV